MKLQISKFLVGLLLVTILPLAFVPAFQAAQATPFSNRTPLATANYSEDFTSTTYRDDPHTTAFGWGDGVVTNSRVYSAHQLDFLATPGEVTSIDVQGRTLYTSVNMSVPAVAFALFDITSPNNIISLSTGASWALQRPVAVSGDIAAMGGGTGPQGVGFYNVTFPTFPFPYGAIYFDGNVTDLEFQGHFLYVANYLSTGSQSFRIIDVENPIIPNLLPTTYVSANVQGLTVDGHMAFLAEGATGLRIVNVSSPWTPGIVDTVNTPGSAMDVIVDGYTAYVADGTGGVQIVDISNLASASIVGSFDTAGEARRLALQGDTLFVADSANGLVILDVTDPSHPILIDTIAINYVWDVDLYGEVVCVGGNSGIYTYLLGNGIAQLPIIGVFDGYTISDVRVQGDVAYVAAGPDGLLTIDVSDPAAPVLLDNYSIGVTYAKKLDVQGYIVAVIESYQFHLFNVEDPSNIQKYSSLPFGGGMDVFLWGELCFYSYAGSGVGYYNISNPYSPVFWQTSIGTNITAIWVQGTYLYAVDDIGGYGPSFYIFDISNLTSFRLIETVSRVGYHYDIFVDGNVAYFADDSPGPGYASIYNVTDPFNTYLTVDFFNDTLGVWALGPWLVTANRQDGVSLHNVTDINNPTTWMTRTTIHAARAVTIHGNYAYVANTTSLVILQLVMAAGNTFALGANTATSLEVDSVTETIENATLTYTAIEPVGTSISFQMSADGGTTWESVTPGVLHTFTVPGNDLRWRATMTTTQRERTVRLYSLAISYDYIVPPTTPTPPPIPGFPFAAIIVGAIIAIGLGMLVRRQKQPN